METQKNRAITTYYEADHDRLDSLFREFQRLKHIDYPQAKQYFKQFKNGLQRHIIWEEEILFPLFEQKTGMSENGPTFVMRMEHRAIGQHLEELHNKVRQQNPDSDREEELLLNVLAMHNDKEEAILYPAIDHSLAEGEEKSVFTAMENLPEERYATCCGGHHHH